MAWYDNNWDYRKKVTLTETSGSTLSNYSVHLNISFVSGHMNSDFSDLRFTSSDEVTELDYWIEDYVSSTSVNVWVKISSLIASSDLDIYMYYGNSSATTISNINNIFPSSSWNTNIAQGKSSSAQYADGSSPASKAVDGSTATQWWGGSSSNGKDSWFNINLGSKYLIMKVGNYFVYNNHLEGVRNWSFGKSGSITQDFGITQYTATQQSYQYKDYTDMSATFSQRIGQNIQVWTDNLAGSSYGCSMGEWVVYGVSRASSEPTYSMGSEESNGPDFTKFQINISDSWKQCAGMKINIGDSWKEVSSAKINIGDSWKTII